jgi:hypothetical protein
MKPIDPQHGKKKQVIRYVGIVLLAIGGLLILIGLGSFFAAFGSSGPPRYFWCAFLGMPIAFVGSVLTGYGFMGAVARYTAGEAAPVAKDTFNYMAEGTQDGVRTMASAIGQGLRGDVTPGATVSGVRCPKCNHTNSEETKFCAECGFSLQKSKPCPSCAEVNDPDAKFCDNCGHSFG